MHRCYIYLWVLNAHFPVTCLLTFQLAWIVNFELGSETAQSVLFDAVAFSVAEDGAQKYDSVFYSKDRMPSLVQPLLIGTCFVLGKYGYLNTGSSLFWKAQRFNQCHCREAVSVALLFPSLCFVAPLVWRRALSKWVFNQFLQSCSLHFLSGWWECPGTIQPNRDIPAWGKGPGGRNPLSHPLNPPTQLRAASCKWPMMFYHIYPATHLH